METLFAAPASLPATGLAQVVDALVSAVHTEGA
jgi:hypothetical protein